MNIMAIIEFIFSAIVIIVMAFFAYMSSHLVSEKKAGHTIPLPWEKGNAKQTDDSKRSQTNVAKCKKQNANATAEAGVFDKSCVAYRDGDNT